VNSPIRTGTTCSGIPDSATCRATPPLPAPRLPVKPESGAQRMAAQSASGIPLELIGLVIPLPADGGPVPGEIVEHQPHAIGHAASSSRTVACYSPATCSPTS